MVSIQDSYEVYDTSRREVRAWLREVLTALAQPAAAYPAFLHCTAGRDRTGVVVAALLRSIGIARECIVEEYLLSEGATAASIEEALRGLERGAPLLGEAAIACLRRALTLGAPG